MAETKGKTVNPAVATTITIGSLGAIGISKPLFDRIRGIMDARGVFSGSTDTNINIPLLEGDDPDEAFRDFFGTGDRGDEASAIEMSDLSVSDREALLGGQEALTSVLNLAIQDNSNFLNMTEQQQRIILNKIFRRQLENRVTKYTQQTPQQIMEAKEIELTNLGINREYLGGDDDVVTDPDAEGFNLQRAEDELDKLIARAERINNSEKDFESKYNEAQGESKFSELENRIYKLQSEEGLSYTEATAIIQGEVELTPQDEAVINTNVKQFKQALEDQDMADEVTADLRRAIQKDPRIANILKLQQASDEQLSAFAEELGIPEDQIIKPTPEALATFEPFEVGDEAGEDVGRAIGRNTYQLTNMLRSGISKSQISDLLGALKSGGKIVLNTASVILLGYAVGKLGVDVFSGEAKKYDIIDTLNALNNTVVAGGSLALGYLGIAGASETAGISMLFMGDLMLFRMAEVTHAEFERNKKYVDTGDALNNNLRTNLIPNLRVLNERHTGEINNNIQKMNNYANLYYEYILKDKGGYKNIPEYSYTSDLPPTRDSKFGRTLDIGDPLRLDDPPDQKKERYEQYKKITDTIAQNILNTKYRNLKYYSGKAYTEQLQKLTNQKDMISTALISSLSRTTGGGGHKEIGKTGALDSKNTEGILETYDLTRNKLLLDKFKNKIYGGSHIKGKTISQQERIFDTNSVLQTTDRNLQEHFERQSKLDPNYNRALDSYTAYVNRQIVLTAQRNSQARNNPQLYNDFVLNFKPLTREQVEHGVPINTLLKFSNNPLLKTKSTINPSETGVHIPPSPFWVYYYQANKRRFVQDDMLRISKISGGVVPPPSPAPKPPPYVPKPPIIPPAPKPKPPKPFKPPVKPDDPDNPPPKPNPHPNPDPKPPYRPTKPIPIRDSTSDFTPQGETEFDNENVAFNPEVALYLLRLVEKAYEPREDPNLQMREQKMEL